MGERALTSPMKSKKHCKWVQTISGSQNNYFSKSESIDLSAPSEGSNIHLSTHLSTHSISYISKSLLDSMMVSTFVAHAEICWALTIVL